MLNILLGSAAIVTAIAVIFGGVIWLARIEGKATRAGEDHSDLRRRIDALEARNADLKVLESQMRSVLAQLGEVSRDVKRLIGSYRRELEE